jgi:ParB family chromosome partitioning protein
MHAWWEPTPENYLDLVPKSKLIAAVTEAKTVVWAKDMPKLKKAEAIAFASEALAGTGWLPLPLRKA